MNTKRLNKLFNFFAYLRSIGAFVYLLPYFVETFCKLLGSFLKCMDVLQAFYKLLMFCRKKISLYVSMQLVKSSSSLDWVCISGTRVDQHETSITLPAVTNGTVGLVRFEAWIKCVAGAVSFNVDYPFWNKPGDFLKPQRRNGVCRAEDCRVCDAQICQR